MRLKLCWNFGNNDNDNVKGWQTSIRFKRLLSQVQITFVIWLHNGFDTLFPWLFSLMVVRTEHAILIANKSENNSHSFVGSFVRSGDSVGSWFVLDTFCYLRRSLHSISFFGFRKLTVYHIITVHENSTLKYRNTLKSS